MRVDRRHSARMMGVGMRNQPVVSHEADLWQQPLKVRKSLCGVVVQYSHAVTAPHRLHLRHHAPALVVSVHEFSERGRIVERSTVDEILDVRDEEMAGEIGLFPDWSQALQVTLCAINAERVVGKLFDNKPALLRTVQRDRNIGLPPRQRECPRQGNKLNEQVGMPRGKPAKLAGKKVIPQSIGSADANSARDRLRRSAKVSTDLKEFRLSPLRCGNESLARARQDAAGRTSFDQLSFQFVLEGGELPRHGRMVHAQTPRGTENLTRAGDLQEYADTIPIHRLQFPHNKSTIVLTDVQTLTFRQRGDCADMRNSVCRRTSIHSHVSRIQFSLREGPSAHQGVTKKEIDPSAQTRMPAPSWESTVRDRTLVEGLRRR